MPSARGPVRRAGGSAARGRPPGRCRRSAASAASVAWGTPRPAQMSRDEGGLGGAFGRAGRGRRWRRGPAPGKAAWARSSKARLSGPPETATPSSAGRGAGQRLEVGAEALDAFGIGQAAVHARHPSLVAARRGNALVPHALQAPIAGRGCMKADAQAEPPFVHGPGRRRPRRGRRAGPGVRRGPGLPGNRFGQRRQGRFGRAAAAAGPARATAIPPIPPAMAARAPAAPTATAAPTAIRPGAAAAAPAKAIPTAARNADPAGHGRPRTGISDSDSGAGADPAGRGRGRGECNDRDRGPTGDPRGAGGAVFAARSMT